jgi:hypothetical protein
MKIDETATFFFALFWAAMTAAAARFIPAAARTFRTARSTIQATSVVHADRVPQRDLTIIVAALCGIVVRRQNCGTGTKVRTGIERRVYVNAEMSEVHAVDLRDSQVKKMSGFNEMICQGFCTCTIAWIVRTVRRIVVDRERVSAALDLDYSGHCRCRDARSALRDEPSESESLKHHGAPAIVYGAISTMSRSTMTSRR